MNGTHPHAGDVRHGIEAFAHLPRRLVGECDGEDIFRRNAEFRDKMRDAGRKDARLAAARTRKHQNRALGIEYGRALFFVELFEFFHIPYIISHAAPKDNFSAETGRKKA